MPTPYRPTYTKHAQKTATVQVVSRLMGQRHGEIYICSACDEGYWPFGTSQVEYGDRYCRHCGVRFRYKPYRLGGV